MINLRQIIKFLSLFLSILFLISSVSATCIQTPDFLKIYSGSNYLGEFSGGDSVYIRPDIKDNPLKLEFLITNSQDNCFDSIDDIQFKLISSGIFISANSISTVQKDNNSYETKATFLFDNEISLPSNFIATFSIQATDNQNPSVDSLYFSSDSSPPIFTQLAYQPANQLLKSKELVTFNIVVSDSGSALESLLVRGKTSQIINFEDRNTSYELSFSEELTSSRTYSFTATDKLGHSSTQEVTFEVDGVAPSLKELEKVYSYDGIRKVSYSVIVEDSSFKYAGNVPTIYGDFSQINPSFNNKLGSCQKSSNLTYLCSWENIEITLGTTSQVNIGFDVSDSLGNNKTYSFTQEIFVDKEPPKVIDFYLKNQLGIKNILSSFDNSSKLYLKFDDESEVTQIILNTGNIQLLNYDNDLSKPSEGYYVWDIGNLAQVYKNIPQGDLTFDVTLIDLYKNKKTETLELKLDNILPKINSVEFIETENIKDGIIKSKEKINFRLLISDNNLDFGGETFIYGDFSTIDFRDGMENVGGNCHSYNSTTLQCDFKGIVVENGYMNRSVQFNIYDAAANLISLSYPVEIFKISDEVFSSYKISDLAILNPINRNLIKDRSVTAWFEGNLQLMGGENITIVNYQLQSCDESGLNPLIIINYKLYPEEIIINEGQEDIDEFAIKVELRNHKNLNDLNDKTMNCSIAVLKRDSQQVFPAELVNFNMKFSFYDVPRGNMLEAHAEKILSMYNDISWMEGWFDEIYDIYHIFNQVCNAINTASGGVGSFNTVMALIDSTPPVIECNSWTAGFCTGGISVGGEKTSEGITSFLQKPPIKTMCDWVTCRNGFGLTDLFTDGAWSDDGLSNSEIGQNNPLNFAVDFIKDNPLTNACAATITGDFSFDKLFEGEEGGE